MTDDELINEVIKRADDFAEKEKRLYAITELEKVDAEILELTNYFYIEPDVFDIIGKHIEDLRGGKDA